MMRTATFTNRIKVQTNVLPTQLTTTEIHETARSIALYYKDGQFVCQTFFTPPLVGEINWVEGLERKADVHFREISLIGPNLFRLRLTGDEDKIRKMCQDDKLYTLIRGINETFTETVRKRRYIEVTGRTDHWDVLLSLDKKRYYLANYVDLDGKTTRIRNIIIVGDRLLGLTDKQEVVIGQLTPDVLEQENVNIKVNRMEEVNKLGKVDLLEPVPNSDDSFLVTIKNEVYQFNIWGELIHFNILEENVKHINSINFNHTRSIMATDNGIYEMDVMEMPNMVKPASLPRKIVNPNLGNKFKVALYVEDPYILGIHPALGVFAKTEDEKVLFF